MDRVEARLAVRPRDFARSVREGLWSTDEGPVRAYFEVRDSDRTVRLAGYALLPGHAGWTRPGAAGPR